jgi:thiosulfate/3-mercaptopyruvate sulfurtransferase
MSSTRRVFLLSAVIAVGLACLTGLAAQPTGPQGKGAVKWVSTEWLQNHLKDPDLLIVDSQPNVHDYFAQHIPGAVYFNDNLLRVPDQGMPARYIPTQAFELEVRRIGLNNEAPVVVYTGKGKFTGAGEGLAQTMVAYSLARFGHTNIYLLNGGIDKWTAENRPVTQEFPKIKEGNFKANVQEDFFVTMDQVKKLKDQNNVILLDARPAKFYEGQGPWIKPGHIPGAVNLPWRSLMADDNATLLKPDAQIAAILKEHSISPDKTIICSCGTGREATNEFLLFKNYLGYPNVKLYEGSFTEWSAYPDNPTVVGPNPK